VQQEVPVTYFKVQQEISVTYFKVQQEVSMTYFKVQQEVSVTYFKVQEGSGRDIFLGVLRQLKRVKKVTNESGGEVGVPKGNLTKHSRMQVRNIIACANLLDNTQT
jgi:hypothetical protein